MPSEDHLSPFLEAMHEGDIARAGAHLSDTVELNSPILPTPFNGRANVTGVLAELLSTIDTFEPRMMMREGADLISVLTIRFEDHVIDAFDHVHLGEDGRIRDHDYRMAPAARGRRGTAAARPQTRWKGDTSRSNRPVGTSYQVSGKRSGGRPDAHQSRLARRETCAAGEQEGTQHARWKKTRSRPSDHHRSGGGEGCGQAGLRCSPNLGQRELEFSGVKTQCDGGADEPFMSEIGTLLPIALCGRNSL